MKKFLRIFVPILLVVAILGSIAWYLLIYDREFTQEILLRTARHCEVSGSHNAAAWFYDLAYRQSGNDEDVAIEMAQRFKNIGNFTKAEYILSNAILEKPSSELYTALCRTYVEQDKLLDAVEMLDKVSNPEIKAELDAMRPTAPTSSLEPGFYSQYLDVVVSGENGSLYLGSGGEYPSVANGVHPGKISLPGGETTIKAVTVGENGLVSPLSIFGYIVGGVIEEVKFADSAVEEAVREILNVGKETAVYTDNLWDIKEFAVPEGTKSYDDLVLMPYLTKLTMENVSFESAEFLSKMKDLETLSIVDGALSSEDIEIIGTLSNLTDLTLVNCGVSNISGLAGLKKLVHLDMSSNTVREIEALSSMTALETLILRHNALTNLSALSPLTGLKEVDISFNSLTSLSPLSGCKAITVLNAADNSIKELGGIENLTGLQKLTLNQNALTDVSALASCTELQTLDISNNAIKEIGALSALVNMINFDFCYNQVETLPELPSDCSLATIDGSHNKLTGIGILKGMKNLNTVNLDYNEELSDISGLADCPVLVQVSVFGTKVTDVKTLKEHNVVVNYNPIANED